MKNLITIIALFFGVLTLQAQTTKSKKMSETQVISLVQTPGEFTEKQVTVKEGSYIFEINNQAGKDVGFVLVPKGKDIADPKNHIQTAYVTALVKDKTTGTSNVTTLEKGEYVYFCPLNETSTTNTLVVE